MKYYLPILFYLVLLSDISVSAAGVSDEPTGEEVSSNSIDTLSTTRLDELVVTKTLTEHEGNKDVITVTKTMREGVKDTGELLGRVTGVHYNPLTTELLYRGSSNVLILVDGVEKDAAYIKRLSPGRFETITVTNTPTGMYSQYDAVIDLHLRPLYQGYEGVLLGEAVLATGDRNGRGKTLRSTREAGQFTYTRERLNIDLYTGYRFSQFGLSDIFSQVYPMNGIRERVIAPKGSEPNQYNRISNYSASVAADYEISKNHSISAKVSVSPSSTRESHSYLLERNNAFLGTSQTLSEYKNLDTHGRLDLTGGLWYRGQIGAWTLKGNASYTGVGYKSVNEIVMSSGYSLDDQRKIKVCYGTAGIEGARYLSNKWFLSISDSFITSVYTADRLQSGELLSKTHDLRNTLDASLQWFADRRVSVGVNAGLSLFKNEYNMKTATHLSPRGGVQLMWQPSSKAFFRVDYRLFSQPPSISAIQDYGQFTDSLVYSSGNPSLRPELNHQLTVSCTLLQRLSIETRYTHTSDAMYNYFGTASGILPSGVEAPYVSVRPVNGVRDNWHLNISYSDRFGPHWLISASAGLQYTKACFDKVYSRRTLPEASWYALYQTFSNTLQIYLSGNVKSMSIIGPQTDMWNIEDTYALSVSKTFFRQRLQILGMWYLPVHITSGKMHGGTTSEIYSQWAEGSNQFRTDNMVQLTLVYRFQGGQSVRKYSRQNESVEI